MKPSTTCILECGTPSWACFIFFKPPLCIIPNLMTPPLIRKILQDLVLSLLIQFNPFHRKIYVRVPMILRVIHKVHKTSKQVLNCIPMLCICCCWPECWHYYHNHITQYVCSSLWIHINIFNITHGMDNKPKCKKIILVRKPDCDLEISGQSI